MRLTQITLDTILMDENCKLSIGTGEKNPETIIASGKVNPFAPISMDVPESKVFIASYDHGFSDEEVEEIKKTYKELDNRDKVLFPLTLEEQITVFKHFRITRTEVFILNTPKVKKPPKEKKPKTEKKLSKKLEDKLDKLYFLIGQQIISEENMKEEDLKFWLENKHRRAEIKDFSNVGEVDLFDTFPLIEATDRLG